jgi:hypothetical protein
MMLIRVKRFRLRERCLRWLFGEKRDIAVIVPGDSVETVSIEEMPEKEGDGNADAGDAG